MRPPAVACGGVVLALALVHAAAAQPAVPVVAVNLFPAQSWLPPPPPPPPPLATPAAPTVPPMPFKYLGQLQDGADIVLFLAHGQRAIVVKAGDTVKSQWRIESVTPRQAVFNYLPLGQAQTLTLRTRP